jgi:hypothetical protein
MRRGIIAGRRRIDWDPMAGQVLGEFGLKVAEHAREHDVVFKVGS